VHSLKTLGAHLFSGDSVGVVCQWDLSSLVETGRRTVADSIICAMDGGDGLLFVASFGAITVRADRQTRA